MMRPATRQLTPDARDEFTAMLGTVAALTRNVAQWADVHGHDALRDFMRARAEQDEDLVRLAGTVDITDVVLTMEVSR